MRSVVAVVALVLLIAGAACAQGVSIDESKLSPEAKALKAKYDAQIQQLQEQFQSELEALSKRLEAVEKPAAPAKPKWYDSVKFNGYFQARYHTREYDVPVAAPAQTPGLTMPKTEVDEFEMRRLYINLTGAISDRSTAVITWAGIGPLFREGEGLSSNADWVNLFVDYKLNPEWTIRVGQGPAWFGLDGCDSSAAMLTPERFLACEGNPVLGLKGVWWAGVWDRGIWAINDQRKSPTDEGLRTVLSVNNGQFRNQDADNSKNVSVDAAYLTKWGQVGVSWLDGKYGGNPRDALNLNFRIQPNTLLGCWGLQGEWIDGEWLGTDRDGWYGQVSYDCPNNPGIVYARYEQFDPNKNAASDEFDALKLGYAYDLTPQDRVTVEGTLGDWHDYTCNDLIFQYQRAF